MIRPWKRFALAGALLLAAPSWAQQSELVIRTGRRLGEHIAIAAAGDRIVNTGALLQDGCLPDVTLWRGDGAPLGVLPSAFDGWYQGVAFSPDGTRIVCTGTFRDRGSSGGEIWDLDGTLISRIGEPEISRNLRAVFSPDGSQVAGCGQDRDGRDTICLWTSSGRKIFEVILPTRDEVQGIAFSPDGGRVVCLLAKTGLAVLDLPARRVETLAVPEARAETCHLEGLAISPDGSTMAACLISVEDPVVGDDGLDQYRTRVTPILLDHTGARIRSLETELSNELSPLGGAVFIADGILLVGINRRTIERRGRSVHLSAQFVIRRHHLPDRGSDGFAWGDGRVSGIAAASNGRVVAAGDAIRIWGSGGGLERSIPDAWMNPKGTIAFSPDGTRFLSGPDPVRLWSMDGRLLGELTFVDRRPSAVAFTPAGDILAAHGSGYEVFNPAGEVIDRYDAGEAWAWHREAIETDGQRVYVPSTEEGIWVHDARSGHGFPVACGGWDVAVSSDGSRFACFRAWSSSGIRVFDRRGEEISRIATDAGDRIVSVAVCPSGAVIWLSECFDGGERAISVGLAPPGDGAVRHIPLLIPAESTGTYRVAAASGGGFVVFGTGVVDPIFVYGASGDLLRRLDGRQGGIVAAAVTPDGTRLVSFGQDASLRITGLAAPRP